MTSGATDNPRKTVLLAIGSLSGLVCLLAVLSSISGQAWIQPLLGSACHQAPDRCLELGGQPMALCARCLAIFLGLTLGSFVALRRPFARNVALCLLLLAALLTALDVGSEFFGLCQNLIPVRLATGLFLGLAVAWMIGHRAESTFSPHQSLQRI